jgi:hypothetical protein
MTCRLIGQGGPQVLVRGQEIYRDGQFRPWAWSLQSQHQQHAEEAAAVQFRVQGGHARGPD